MIFVTVGTDLPFDRMVKVIDEWARESGREDVFAQIGEGGWEPSHISFVRFLPPSEFAACFKKAVLVISHAGMGTILSALHHGKPILVMPKRASMREHRNEHQTATALRMVETGRVNVAFDEDELRQKLAHLNELSSGSKIERFASASLVSGIRQFIFDGTSGSNDSGPQLVDSTSRQSSSSMADLGDFVIVTPVRDEEATIGRTIDSVTSQTIQPREWLIVSDGSTDKTDEIVRRASENHPWIRLLQLGPRPRRSFAAVVDTTEAGIKHLSFRDYRYICLLDGDIIFQRDYFEQLLQRFNADPALGLGGGVVIDSGLPRDRFPTNCVDVPGAVQFFSRECFDSIGGLIAVPEGGWDGITCAVARMNGYKTRLFTDLIVDHLKPRNCSEGGFLRRKWQMGVRDYAIGYHPVFEAAKCSTRLTNRPLIVGAFAWWVGYCTAALRHRNRIVPEPIVRHIRKEQLDRLRCIFNFTSKFLDSEP